MAELRTIARMSAPHGPYDSLQPALVLGNYIPSTRRELVTHSPMCRTQKNIGKIAVYFGTNDQCGTPDRVKSVYLPFFKEASCGAALACHPCHVRPGSHVPMYAARTNRLLVTWRPSWSSRPSFFSAALGVDFPAMPERCNRQSVTVTAKGKVGQV